MDRILEGKIKVRAIICMVLHICIICKIMLQINTTFLHLSFIYYIRCIKLICYCNRNDKPNDLIIQLENVAYSICGDNPVTFPKFQQIFSTKEVSVIVKWHSVPV